ncbi:MAG: phosphotransferase [Muribaculaceae bacterium]|nr:phosphotransferase [Muribaculaceae bacterium]MDE6753226.1 phosphotransferase [Muribaculaceae bacterium]
MKTAVILCARREKDSDIPYPVMPFSEDGTTLIDRNLSLLREEGISRIIIVVGYRHELFERFKAEDTEIVFNHDFEFTSSMGSLACCRDLIEDDFLLVEGDTFFEHEVLKRLMQSRDGNMFTMTEESGSGDECFVETRNGYILNISKDRHRVRRFEGELMGISRISLQTFKGILYLWDNSDNSVLNYEYLVMDATTPLDRPVLKFRNTIWGDVDSRDDFKKLRNKYYLNLRRKENPYDEANLRNHIANIFATEDVSSARITRIGGMSNKNFRVEFKGKGYVLRVPGNGSEGMVERSNEEFNAIEACRLGVNPPVRYFDSTTGIKLADFIEDAETLNAATIQRHSNMKKIAEIYRKIHDSHIRLRNEFNIFQEIEKYDILIQKAGAQMYPGWDSVRREVMQLEQRLNRLGVDLKPCHNDALYENFIKDPSGRIYLIDWEYSGMNDPMADLAALFLEAEFEEENADYFLEKYFEGNIPPQVKEKILCYQILWDYLWAQWTVIKESKGDDFGSYGQDRFNRAVANLKLIQNR